MFFYIETLGCKVNQFESAALESLLRERGHTLAEPSGPCDAVILNTCAVTGDASRQSRQAARRLKRAHPDALLAVCGCTSQISPGEMKSLGASLIGGSGERTRFVHELEELAAQREIAAKTIVDDPKLRRTIEPLPSGAPSGRTRAMIKIQDGCDNFCSYCVIPYARGRVRSLPVPAAVEDAKSLAEQGFLELVLTGIEISSYGKDLPEKPTLAELVCELSNAVPDTRLRLGSLEPSTVTPEFVRTLQRAPNLCEHFHLSLQSGSDDVLKAMRRKYSAAEFLDALSLLREAFPNCGATADVIMGFPGETEENVQETLDFLQRCAFSDLHVFPFSKRPGTKAAEMPNQLQNAVKKERAAKARELGEHSRTAFLESQRGKTLEALFEREADGRVYGHTRNYIEISVPAGAEPLRNRLRNVEITGFDNGGCRGRLI